MAVMMGVGMVDMEEVAAVAGLSNAEAVAAAAHSNVAVAAVATQIGRQAGVWVSVWVGG